MAEVCASPLASEKSLSLALIELNSSMSGHTLELWRDTERLLLSSFPAFSVDEALAFRDLLWFGSPRSNADGEERTLGDYLRGVAGAFLVAKGNVGIPRISEEIFGTSAQDVDFRGRRWWRWLTFALPPDLIFSALDGSILVERLCLLSPLLEKELKDSGYGEPHLHLGAGLRFETMWISTLWSLVHPDFNPENFGSPGAELDEGRRFPDWLARVAVARYLLADFLSSRSIGVSGFEEYLREHLISRIEERLGWVRTLVLGRCLADLARGSLGDESIWEVVGLYRRITSAGELGESFPQRLSEVRYADPVWWRMSRDVDGGVWPEVVFLRSAFRYLRERRSDRDRTFERLFWQVVRVRCLYYRYLVQRPMTPGLTWFLRHYRRMAEGRRPIRSGLRVDSALEISGAGRGLRSLEVRDAPSPAMSENLQVVRDVAGLGRENPKVSNSGYRSGADLESGLIFHFSRDYYEGGEQRESSREAFGSSSNGDPSRQLFRYSKYYRRRKYEASSLISLLRIFPAAICAFRALDLCSNERSIPAWVFVPLFKAIRSAADEASAIVSSNVGTRIRGLATTVHAGEDFIHLAGGLRRIDEALDKLELVRGDRIGHGIALGADPEEWASYTGRAAITKEERLFDLLWEWEWYIKRGLPSAGGRAEVIDYSIRSLGRAIFGRSCEPEVLSEFYGLLYDARVMEEFFSRSAADVTEVADGIRSMRAKEEASLALNPESFFYEYLLSVQVFKRGQEIEMVDPDRDLEALKVLQSAMRSKVARRGIAVEVNPSSNLLIGNLADLHKHPLWRLHPLEDMGENSVMSVVIGSDDPLTFATSTPNEYQLLYDTMVQGGLSDARARDWIGAARAASLNARFTLEISRERRKELQRALAPWSTRAKGRMEDWPRGGVIEVNDRR